MEYKQEYYDIWKKVKIYISNKKTWKAHPSESQNLSLNKDTCYGLVKSYKDGYLMFDKYRFTSKKNRQKWFFPKDNLKAELLKIDPALEIAYV